jgi:signal recognition particle receptor subunit beta
MGIEEIPPPLHLSVKTADRQGQTGDIAGNRIGAALDEVRTRLAAIAERLEPNLDPHALPIVTEARRVLREQTCRVAVIGQIKAGKSSFINALTQRTDLLPTDINPWTSVVTSLHFRRESNPPEHAAVFKMFSREEWQRLAEGGGRLRELTERLVPGFEPELLRAQIEVMRQRVEQRLGPEFDELLGQTHRYPAITSELLDDYVSAGTYLAAGAEGQRPVGRKQYSDITRTADLYLTGGPFAFPVTLVDTPGTNDPFLVRDEITRRSLENADVYVFVISALQPLSANDISLLRILNGLHKDRIVVFINRIDQLRSPTTDGAAVTAAVKTRLDREFPALDIPVISGSAWWGGLSLVAAGKDISRVLPQASLAYLREVGLPASLEFKPGQPMPPEDRARLAQALYKASGMPAIGAALTAQLNNGSASVLLRQLAACFLELARTTEVSAKMELQSVMSLAEARRVETHAVGERIRQERAALANLDGPIAQIQASFALIEKQLADIVSEDVRNLRADLDAIVERFADEECNALSVSIRRRDHDGAWRTDLRPLRDDLEVHYVNSYRDTEARLIEIERVLYPQLRTIVDAIVPGSGIDVADDYANPTNPYPSLAPLAETATLDLGLPWWRAWLASRPDPDSRSASLRKIILDDFIPVAEELSHQAENQLGTRVARTLQQAQVVSAGMLTAIQARKAQVLTDYEALLNPASGTGAEDLEAQSQARIERCKTRHQTTAKLVGEISELVSFCHRALGREALV